VAYLVRECDELGEVHWEWQAVDGVMGKSRFGGGKTGPNPTDRAKMGTKKSVHVEQHGGPLAVEIDGANVHDTKMLEQTINAVVVPRPDPETITERLCLDKGYDNPTGEAACAKGGYVPHIRRIGEEKKDG
jgi:putative transposase